MKNIEENLDYSRLPTNTPSILIRMIGVLEELKTDSLCGCGDDPRLRQLLWLLNSQWHGSAAIIDMPKEWYACQKELQTFGKSKGVKETHLMLSRQEFIALTTVDTNNKVGAMKLETITRYGTFCHSYEMPRIDFSSYSLEKKYDILHNTYANTYYPRYVVAYGKGEELEAPGKPLPGRLLTLTEFLLLTESNLHLSRTYYTTITPIGTYTGSYSPGEDIEDHGKRFYGAYLDQYKIANNLACAPPLDKKQFESLNCGYSHVIYLAGYYKDLKIIGEPMLSEDQFTTRTICEFTDIDGAICFKTVTSVRVYSRTYKWFNGISTKESVLSVHVNNCYPRYKELYAGNITVKDIVKVSNRVSIGTEEWMSLQKVANRYGIEIKMDGNAYIIRDSVKIPINIPPEGDMEVLKYMTRKEQLRAYAGFLNTGSVETYPTFLEVFADGLFHANSGIADEVGGDIKFIAPIRCEEKKS